MKEVFFRGEIIYLIYLKMSVDKLKNAGSSLLTVVLAVAVFACGSSYSKPESNGTINSPTPVSVRSDMNVQTGKAMPEGVWSGENIQFSISTQGVEIIFPCADGKIDRIPLLNSKGEFKEPGTYERMTPGPQREDRDGPASAFYSGTITGETMELKITLKNGDTIGDFALTKGAGRRIRRCQ